MKSAKRVKKAEVSPLMQEVSAYIAGALKRPLPDNVVEKTKHHVLDTIAAMVSGAPLLPGRKAIAFAKTRAGGKEACVAASRIVTTAEFAALANGMLAHADETDDSHAPSLSHPGCAVVPAALAMGEREGRNGTQLLRAVALGYDIGTRLNMALHAYDFREAGHSTHSFGPMFGAAAAAGALAGVNTDRARWLLSYTAQQCSGVSCWMRDEEHIEKAFDFGGMPARNGVAAAAMVAAGFTGVEDVFSGERNFFVAYDETRRIGKAPEPERLARELGSTYEIMNTNIKRWSVGSPIQAPLDALLDLIRAHTIKAVDVERVTVRVAHQGANTTNNRNMPDICMQHMCAVMLLDGIVTFKSAHDEKRMRDPKVLALRSKVELYGDDELTRAMPSRQGIVELRLTGGRELRQHVEAVRGTAQNPMTRAEVDEKSYHLLVPVLGKKKARALCDAVWALDKLADVRKLRPLLRP
ncbi:MAG: MmgE/PrpD family protein [Betaproteobacteria bacterium]|nr:MAG: MmgE/PrpD family protein [Betaproteobacteria bacterium]